MKYILVLLSILSTFLFSKTINGYELPQSYISDYRTDITILADNEMKKSENIHFYANYNKNSHHSYEDADGLHISSNSPIFELELPYQKYLYDFEVFFNGKDIEWHKINFPHKLILNSVYQADHHYRYMINYKETLIPQYGNEHIDKIKWDLLNRNQLTEVQHFEAHIHLPKQLNKTNIQLHFSFGKPELNWINDHYFTISTNNFPMKDLIITISYPKELMGQTTRPARAPIKKEIKPFVESTNVDSLVYWQFALLLMYMIFLYYYARHYGSFAAMGSIPVRYEPPRGISLLQSGYIIDEKNNAKDLLAAVIELVSMGYLHIKIMDKAYAKDLIYLEKTDKTPDTLTADQKYLLNRILFLDGKSTQVSSVKQTFFGKFQRLDREIRDTLKLKGLVHFDIKRAQQSFMIKSFLSALPIFVFFSYTTFLIYGPDLMAIMDIFMLFFIFYVIIGTFTRHKDTLLGAYFIYFMLLIPFIVKAGSLKVLFAGPMFALPVITALVVYFNSKITKLTGKGLNAYKELLGYKEFVERTELPKFKYLLEDHPEHIEKSLSYALLFNMISHKLMSKF